RQNRPPAPPAEPGSDGAPAMLSFPSVEPAGVSFPGRRVMGSQLDCVVVGYYEQPLDDLLESSRQMRDHSAATSTSSPTPCRSGESGRATPSCSTSACG